MSPVLCPSESVPAEVLEHLESLVRGQLSGRIFEFRLLPRDEGLVLQGHTHTYYAKQLAQAALMATTRYPIVANEIEVT